MNGQFCVVARGYKSGVEKVNSPNGVSMGRGKQERKKCSSCEGRQNLTKAGHVLGKSPASSAKRFNSPEGDG